MSPEQALGKPVDTRTDLFSFGILLYEMCTGRSPFAGDTTGELLISIVQQVQITPAQLNPGVPEGLARIIDRCLEKNRELRYQHASEIRADLERVQRDPAAVVDRPSPFPQEEPPSKTSSGPQTWDQAVPGEAGLAAALAGAPSRAAGYCHRDDCLLPGKHPARSRGFKLYPTHPRWRGKVTGRHGRVEALFGHGISDCTRNRADAGHGRRPGPDAGSGRIYPACWNIARRHRIARYRTPGSGTDRSRQSVAAADAQWHTTPDRQCARHRCSLVSRRRHAGLLQSRRPVSFRQRRERSTEAGFARRIDHHPPILPGWETDSVHLGKKTSALRIAPFGRSLWRGNTFIACFRAGINHPPMQTETGPRMGSFLSLRRMVRYGRSRTRRAFSGR